MPGATLCISDFCLPLEWLNILEVCYTHLQERDFCYVEGR